jgi:hypothetical protein
VVDEETGCIACGKVLHEGNDITRLCSNQPGGTRRCRVRPMSVSSARLQCARIVVCTPRFGWLQMPS